jgi:hypothetical protein
MSDSNRQTQLVKQETLTSTPFLIQYKLMSATTLQGKHITSLNALMSSSKHPCLLKHTSVADSLQLKLNYTHI